MSTENSHAQRMVEQTMIHTLRPKSGNRVLVVAEVLTYLKDNLGVDTPEGKVVPVKDIDTVLLGLMDVPEFAGGHHDY